MCMYMYYNQPGILERHELVPPPTFAFGKIIPSGLKMGHEHNVCL